MVVAGVVASEASVLSLQMIVFLLCPHIILHIPGVFKSIQISSFYKDT